MAITNSYHRLRWCSREDDLALASARLDAAARSFFALSPARKAMASLTLPDGTRIGWSANDDTGHSGEERFQYRARCGMFPWPDDCGTGCSGAEFHAATLAFYYTARRVLIGELETFDKEGGIMDVGDDEDDEYSTLFVSCRSAGGGDVDTTPRKLRSSGHTDHGMLTLLSLGAIDGDHGGAWRLNTAPLHIYNRSTGTWGPLLSSYDGGGGGDIGFVVMAGEQLAAATSGAISACVHRVGGSSRAPPDGGDRARVSMSLQLRARRGGRDHGGATGSAGAEAAPRPSSPPSSLRPIALHFR